MYWQSDYLLNLGLSRDHSKLQAQTMQICCIVYAPKLPTNNIAARIVYYFRAAVPFYTVRQQSTTKQHRIIKRFYSMIQHWEWYSIQSVGMGISRTVLQLLCIPFPFNSQWNIQGTPAKELLARRQQYHITWRERVLKFVHYCNVAEQQTVTILR